MAWLCSPEQRAKNWPFGSHREKVASGYRTDLEAMAEEALLELGLDYEFEFEIGKRYADFALLDDRIVLEVGHPRWHDPEKDRIRDDEIAAKGWIVLHVPCKELRRDPVVAISRILDPYIDWFSKRRSMVA